MVLGLMFGVLYTPFKIFRIAFCSKKVSVYVADIIFMLVITVSIFYFSLAYLFGYIRIYVLLGSMAGFFAYRLTIGRLFSKFYCPVIAFFKALSHKIHLKIKKIAKKLLKIAYNILYNVSTKINIYKDKRLVATKNKRVMARDEKRKDKEQWQTGAKECRKRHHKRDNAKKT